VTTDGDSWNPQEWVDRHGDYLYRFALARLHNPHDAEEAVQDTLLAAWRNRDKFQARAAERTWLTGILKHKINDCFRAQVRTATHVDSDVDVAALESMFKADGHGRIPTSGWSGNPATAAENVEFWVIFHDCASHLPERTASVFIMRELDRMDGGEICKVLDITPTNYWVRLHRARLKLRECLERNWFQGKRD
jgi:RNA polymerase sigma-70 factor (TIGR02943 family)